MENVQVNIRFSSSDEKEEFKNWCKDEARMQMAGFLKFAWNFFRVNPELLRDYSKGTNEVLESQVKESLSRLDDIEKRLSTLDRIEELLIAKNLDESDRLPLPQLVTALIKNPQRKTLKSIDAIIDFLEGEGIDRTYLQFNTVELLEELVLQDIIQLGGKKKNVIRWTR